MDQLMSPNGIPPLVPPQQFLMADDTYRALMRYLQAFQEKLDATKEIGAVITYQGRQDVLHVADVDYYNPSLLVMYGRLASSGQEVEFVVHHHRLELVFEAVKPLDQTAHRIGF